MRRTKKVTAAGVLNIISGIIGILRGLFILILVGFIGVIAHSISLWFGELFPWVIKIQQVLLNLSGDILRFIIIVGFIIIAFGIVSLIGGIYAFKRRRWGVALGGSILAIGSIPLFGVLSVIFVSLRRGEFTPTDSYVPWGRIQVLHEYPPTNN